MALGQEEIGARIKQARDELGLTQQEFAERIGLKNGANVSRLERGVDELTSKRLRRIIDATRKPAEFFVRDPHESPRDGNHDGASREAQQALQEIRETLVNLAQAVEEVSTEVRELRREVASSQRRVPANGEH